MIATFKKSNHWPMMAAAVFASLALVTLTDAQTGSGVAGNQTDVKTQPEASPVPLVIATSPAAGAIEVDPALGEITVTFDRDMGQGFSWTGGGPDYPPGLEGQKPNWRDKRTCVLPVKLEPARYYRVGINAKSFQNFCSAEGSAAKPMAIYFTTKGASEELKNKTLKPRKTPASEFGVRFHRAVKGLAVQLEPPAELHGVRTMPQASVSTSFDSRY